MCNDKNAKCSCPSCKEHTRKKSPAPVLEPATLVPSGFVKKENRNTNVAPSGSGYTKKNGLPATDLVEAPDKVAVSNNAEGDPSGAYIAGVGFLFLLIVASRRE